MYLEAGGQHPSSHFHAYYGDDAAIYTLPPFDIIAGSLPRLQKRLVEVWAELYLEELETDWLLPQTGQPPVPCVPSWFSLSGTAPLANVIGPL